MTIKELSQLYYLNREIERDKTRLEELYAKAASTTPVLSGMPHAPGVSDRVGKYAVEIADLWGILEENIRQRTEERATLLRYISDIPDSLTRQIFTLRFDDCLGWEQVAERVGGGNTGGSVKQRVFREIRKSSSNVTP